MNLCKHLKLKEIKVNNKPELIKTIRMENLCRDQNKRFY